MANYRQYKKNNFVTTNLETEKAIVFLKTVLTVRKRICVSFICFSKMKISIFLRNWKTRKA